LTSNAVHSSCYRSEERGEPMSSDPIPEDENPEIDEGTISEVIRKPTRTAGDLSEVVEGPTGLTTEEVARDLESAASKSRTQTESELLKDLLRRVERIEQHLGIASTGSDDALPSPSQ
jgi:hypothetical protein